MTTRKPKTDLQVFILNQIEQQGLSSTQIVKLMGYQSVKSQTKAVKRLQHVLSLRDLGLSVSSYDFKYSSIEFIHALCRVLNIAKEDYLNKLNQLEHHFSQCLNVKKPTVYANVTFSDNYRPSFTTVMAMSKFTQVKLDDDIHTFSTYNQLHVILKAIKHHYTAVTGNLPFDGVVNEYRISLYGLDAQSDKHRLIIPAIFD